jgi:hypothetical protein
MTEVVFYEEQKFTQRWVRILLYTVWAAFLVLCVFMAWDKEVGLYPAVLIFVIVSAFMIAFKSLKLVVRISDDAICYRLSPFQRRFKIILKEDIANLEIKSFDALGEYGGWGIRFGKAGVAYTVKGSMGMTIKLAKNKSVLIGTSRPEELKSFLEANGYMSKK